MVRLFDRLPRALWLLILWWAAAISACSGSSGDESDVDSDWRDWQSGCVDDPEGDIATGTTWQWQLTGTIDTGVEAAVYDVDLFDTPQAAIDTLKAEGRLVICYFSAGTFESWREDAADFPEAAIGKAMADWEDEQWVDIRSAAVRAIMAARMDRAVTKGCDGVEPDNMDGYLPDNHSGFDFDGLDQLDYNRYIADEAHTRGLCVGLKNDVDQLEALAPCFDWALNEECLTYDECNRYTPFIAAKKAVFHVEYVDDPLDGEDLAGSVCGNPAVKGFSTLIKEGDLTEWVIPCW